MDAIDMLTADHNRVRGLFARYKDAHEGKDVTDESELVDKIVRELEIHTTIEEETFYPAVRELNDELEEKVGEALQEHHVAKVLMVELESLPPRNDEWAAKVAVLIESVGHHAGEEEREMFPAVRRATNAEWLSEVAERLEANQKALGAPVLGDKINLSTAELKEMASTQQIPGRSSMSKEELAATVDPG